MRQIRVRATGVVLSTLHASRRAMDGCSLAVCQALLKEIKGIYFVEKESIGYQVLLSYFLIFSLSEVKGIGVLSDSANMRRHDA